MSDAGTQGSGILDIAVVGGGVGGAYTAYRLLKAQAGDSPILDGLRKGKPRLSVTLFEESSRIGGRLWSHRDPGLPELPIELGGQGFSELQQNVYGLCTKELCADLTVVDCAAFSLGPQLQYQRRHRFPYQAYSPLPPDPSTLTGLLGQERAKQLRSYRAFIFKLCPTVPPLPEPLETQDMDKIAAWCSEAKTVIRALPDYYPGVVPYFLEDKEKWTDPFQLQLNVLLGLDKQLADAFAVLASEVQQSGASPKAFTQINALQNLLRTTVTPDGQTLNTHGFWNFFRDRLTSEAYSMGGFASFASSSIGNWNLYDSTLAMIWGTLMYMLKTPFYSVEEGYDELPKTMLKRFRAAGGHVASRQRVYEVAVDESQGDPLVSLTVGPPDGSSECQKIYARYLVLALPKAALEQIQWGGSLHGITALSSDIASVQPVHASKVFMVYPEPWWEHTPSMSLKGGYSTTDLPLRACYYMGSQPDGRSLLLASLSDEEAETFWAAYERASDGQATKLGVAPGSVREMVEQIQGQLTEIHGVKPPPPLAGPICFDWAGAPFGGGWHDWKPGLKSWEVMPRIRRLSVDDKADARVFLCGEAYSNQQGWVEGALNTAEMVLETYFGLPRPDWVAITYGFGP
jgi:monoamine oxidase